MKKHLIKSAFLAGVLAFSLALPASAVSLNDLDERIIFGGEIPEGGFLTGDANIFLVDELVDKNPTIDYQLKPVNKTEYFRLKNLEKNISVAYLECVAQAEETYPDRDTNTTQKELYDEEELICNDAAIEAMDEVVGDYNNTKPWSQAALRTDLPEEEERELLTAYGPLTDLPDSYATQIWIRAKDADDEYIYNTRIIPLGEKEEDIPGEGEGEEETPDTPDTGAFTGKGSLKTTAAVTVTIGAAVAVAIVLAVKKNRSHSLRRLWK